MLPPRLTILRLMYLVLICAIDAALMRDWYAGYSSPGASVSAFSALEFGMMNLLGFSLDRAIFSGAQRRTFARGFFLVGIVPLAAVALVCSLYSGREVFIALWPLLDVRSWERLISSSLTPPRGRLLGGLRPALVLAVMTSVFALPQVLVASAGGATNVLVWRITQRLRTRPIPDPAPTASGE